MSKLMIALLVVLLALFIFFVALLLLSIKRKEAVVSFLGHFLFFIPWRFREKVMSFINSFVEGMKVIQVNPQNLSQIIVLTILAVTFDALYFFMMFRAFDASASFAIVFFGYTLLSLTYIIPMPPAQIGVNELLMVLIFSIGLSVDRNLASAVMVSAHALTGILIFAIGFASLGFLRIRIQEALLLK